MIFISSSCVKNKYINESVRQLAEMGFRNIELSGGTQFYENIKMDLLSLKKEYDLNYICHNYFPPPSSPFVVNLASLDDEVYELSLEHLKRAIDLSTALEADRFGFHAGFLINIPIKEIGRSINNQELFDREAAKARFIEGYKVLEAYSKIPLYLENNVVSATNYNNFGNTDPFFMSQSQEIFEFSEQINFGLILDVAHLKVSANTLGLALKEELDKLMPVSNYIHISDNDGKADTNQPLEQGSELYEMLKKYDFNGAIFTIEVYSGLDAVANTHQSLELLL